MRAIIPVAGMGTRLRPHTFTVPKVLLNVAGQPILGHILDKIIGEGITSATVVVGHMSDKIREFVESAYPSLKAEYVQQDDPMGLGHAIYLSREYLKDEPVLIILGDTIFDVDLKPVLRGTETAIGVKSVDDPRRFGVAETDNGYITRLVEKPEKPASNLAVVGLYYIRNGRSLAGCLEQIVASDIRTRGEYQLTDALQMMLTRGEKMRTFDVEGWYDCGKPETLLSTNRALLEKRSCPRVIEGVVIQRSGLHRSHGEALRLRGRTLHDRGGPRGDPRLGRPEFDRGRPRAGAPGPPREVDHRQLGRRQGDLQAPERRRFFRDRNVLNP